ncbi:radical SAM family heme chaperone HemW [Chitinivibrio alkaliphilus]|uniref:Heme chaperone HemW n=1 Tax=Chitinivibrio alkaliphilus ACht1 TaxID=1313304 RepID=U7DDI7_9BACT|nr:radical SAM family heme chaperone HemW [Chitinivibrio alkaliphilus]ERP38951.1 oxygen-independent coproporphyrinogen III oxidase [Chitinivibrio alkaliphilus ACht1]
MPPRIFSTTKDLSLYIHVPFCAKKCPYCDFYSCPPHDINSYIKALSQEVDGLFTEAPHLEHTPLRSVFIGGGTPSLFGQESFLLLAEIVHRFTHTADMEWTLEVNPEHFSSSMADLWCSQGVTRISLGVQTLQAKELRHIGRNHTPDDIERIFANASIKQFHSISCDIIYGLPGQTEKGLIDTIEKLTKHSSIGHISAYELTRYPTTPFGKDPSIPFPTEEELEKLTEICHDTIEQAQFYPYEISNFARTVSDESCHNKAYWERRPYLGLGPGAHSYDGSYRLSRPADLSGYTKETAKGYFSNLSVHQLSREEHREEYLFLSLRTRRGILKQEFLHQFKEPLFTGIRKEVISDLCAAGFLREEPQRVYPTRAGMLRADGIALRLL